jgi:hypothetical protein
MTRSREEKGAEIRERVSGLREKLRLQERHLDQLDAVGELLQRGIAQEDIVSYRIEKGPRGCETRVWLVDGAERLLRGFDLRRTLKGVLGSPSTRKGREQR